MANRAVLRTDSYPRVTPTAETKSSILAEAAHAAVLPQKIQLSVGALSAEYAEVVITPVEHAA
jgi:hypothetical protein